MELNKCELKNIIFGAIQFKEDGEWLTPIRFTDKTLNYYEETSEDFYIKTKASSCMQMDFETDSDFISFDYKCKKASSRSVCYIDVYIDNVLMIHEGISEFSDTEGTLKAELKKGKKRVTVFLPNLFCSSFKNFELSENATVTPYKKDRKILFLGDSITQGYTAIYPSFSYANIISKELNAESLNQAIGGDFFNKNNLDESLPFNPDTVFVAYGTNDWSQGKDIQTNAAEYYDKLTEMFPNAAIYSLLPIWRGKDGTNNTVTFEKMREILAEICKKYKNVTVIDTIDFVPHYPEFFQPDLLHPCDLGFIMYGKSILEAIS